MKLRKQINVGDNLRDLLNFYMHTRERLVRFSNNFAILVRMKSMLEPIINAYKGFFFFFFFIYNYNSCIELPKDRI